MTKLEKIRDVASIEHRDGITRYPDEDTPMTSFEAGFNAAADLEKEL